MKGIISQVTQIADNSEYVFASAGSGRYQLLLSAVYNASGSVYADKGNYLFDQSSARYYAAQDQLVNIGSLTKPVACVIYPRQLTVSWSEGIFTYNASRQGITLTVNNAVAGDIITITAQVNAYTDSSMTQPLWDSGLAPEGQATIDLYGGGNDKDAGFHRHKSGILHGYGHSA